MAEDKTFLPDIDAAIAGMPNFQRDRILADGISLNPSEQGLGYLGSKEGKSLTREEAKALGYTVGPNYGTPRPKEPQPS
ncbi:MAG TPA: hypothetical protein VHB73_07365 [Alphaproteobacteria bacterium]|nr:hypothetical protein [Alphaproteobacteria bacterium]